MDIEENKVDIMKESLTLAYKERLNQVKKFGNQYSRSIYEWASILGEEFGELCEAVNETYLKDCKHPDRGGQENILNEATHVAAVALAMIESMLNKKYND